MRARRLSIAVAYDLTLHAEDLCGPILIDVFSLGERQWHSRRPDGNFTEGHTGTGIVNSCLVTVARITVNTSRDAVQGLVPPRGQTPRMSRLMIGASQRAAQRWPSSSAGPGHA